jgi:hypothetical protein
VREAIVGGKKSGAVVMPGSVSKIALAVRRNS